jgi:tRNA (guanine37-N1)-methyltransferase
MKFKILTIFPDFFREATNFSILKRAQQQNIITVEIFDLRNWAKPGVHKQIDDRPYGGGPGMVMMVEPLYNALQEIKDTTLNPEESKTVIFSPKGETYKQPQAENLSQNCKEIILIVPHYEGFDDRILNFIDLELSIGDYVLTGGELPALVVMDSVTRLLPGALGNEASSQSESFSELKSGVRTTEHPQYTRPEIFVDRNGTEYRVPEVLLSGHHKRIEEWKGLNFTSQDPITF